MTIKRNVVANYLGQAWSAVMALAFLPLYIRFLGMEAYGLVGLFALAQAWMTLLDMGMTPTLGREMARFSAGGHSAQSVRNLLLSLEVVCILIALATCAGVWLAADWLASDWLRADKLPQTVVAGAIEVMAFVIALRFVEGLYRSALIGLQRQVWWNIANALLSTARALGAWIVLAQFSSTINAFFWWQAIASLGSIAVLSFATHGFLPSAPARTSFSLPALRRVSKFARGMVGITFLSILLMQIDKVLLSRLLPLEIFGYYSLAATVAATLYYFITPVTTALYPHLTALSLQTDELRLVSVYHRGAQLIAVLATPPALLLAFYPEGIVYLWSGNVGLANALGSLLAALAIGNLLNGLMYLPYQLQLAHGWTGLTFLVNLVAVAIMVPLIFWCVPRYGAVGAAVLWIVLNASCMIITVQLMHRRILRHEKWNWYLRDVAMPVAGTLVVLLGSRVLQPSQLKDRQSWAIFLASSLALASGASLLTARDLRPFVYSGLRRFAGLSSTLR